MVMTTSVVDQSSCRILYRLEATEIVSCSSPAGNSQMPGPEHVSLQASETDRWCSWKKLVRQTDETRDVIVS